MANKTRTHGPGKVFSITRAAMTAPAHWMLREILEQPQVIRATLAENGAAEVLLPKLQGKLRQELSSARKIVIAASGSSRHAGLAGEVMIEDLSGVSVDVEYASEFRCRASTARKDALVIVMTQSGETADAIAALREGQRRGSRMLAITNVPDSTIARETHGVLLACAGRERAIPATKSFTAQLVVMYVLALFFANARGKLDKRALEQRLEDLRSIASGIEGALARWDAETSECARRLRRSRAFLFLGRGVHYAIAREGALKLKEVSYRFAEGLPAGELRHGPNALLDRDLAVIVLATRDPADADSTRRYEETLGTLEYIRSRGGRALAIATQGDGRAQQLAWRTLFVPQAPELLAPVVEVVPLQLLAYHFGLLRHANVDRPRNLVKAVTRA